jgi:hypothetical protein
MAYQPKSYRKFVATAATATLVATAVTPAFAAENLPFIDVNKNYAEAVGALYSKNIVKGVSKTEFGTYQSLKRGDAAVIIAKALELDTKNAPDAGFKDVNSKIKGAVNALVAKGIISGVSKDKFDPESSLTRGQMAKILVNSYPVLKDASKETPFKDLTADFKPYIEALYGAGITGGTSDTTYGTTQKITRGDFAKLLYKAMNYKKSVPESIKPIDDITVDEGTKLEDVKLPEKVTVVYSDKSEKEASVKWDTSKVDTSKPGTYKVEGTVDGTDLKASVNVVVKEVAPKVESVSANNLKSAVVTFNKAVDKDSVTNDTVKVLDKDGNVIATTLKLVDSKTLAVVYNTPLNQSDEVELVVDGVKTTDGANVTKYDQSFTVNDTTLPVVQSARALNPKQVELKFSEPVNFSTGNGYQVLNNITIDGIPVIAKATPNAATNTVVLEFSSPLTAGTKKLAVSGISDYANFKIAKSEFSIDVTEDKAAPEITKAEMINKNKVRVTFNESLADAGSFKVNGYDVTATAVPDSNNTQFDLDTSAHPLDLSAIVEVKVEYKGQKDLLDNQVADWQKLTFSVQDDTTLPTVQSLLETGNKLTLTFSKSMNTTSGTITVLDKDKKVIKKLNVSDLTFKANTDNKVLELSGSDLGLNNVDPADYTINIKDMKDATVRENLLPEQNIVIKAFDTKKPTIVDKYVVKKGTLTGTDEGKDDTITFYFSEPMDEGTLKNLSNYVTEDGYAFSTIDGVSVKSVAADKKSVTITYPNARSFDKDVVVQGLKDLAGNLAVKQTVTKNEDTDLDVASIEATKKNEIDVTFNTPVKSVDPSFIQVVKGSDPYAVPVKAEIDSQDPTKVKFTLNKDLGTDTSVYTVKTNDYTKVENIYDAKFADKDTADSALQKTITDKLAPEITKFTVSVDGESTPREATISSDKASATLDLSSVVDEKEIKDVKITSSENADLEVLLPLLDKLTSITGIGSNDKHLSAGDNTIEGKSSLTVGALRQLAAYDGDGSKDTLTITAQVSDGHSNTSDVKLVVKVN